jgi:hypothetical protein
MDNETRWIYEKISSLEQRIEKLEIRGEGV